MFHLQGKTPQDDDPSDASICGSVFQSFELCLRGGDLGQRGIEPRTDSCDIPLEVGLDCTEVVAERERLKKVEPNRRRRLRGGGVRQAKQWK